MRRFAALLVCFTVLVQLGPAREIPVAFAQALAGESLPVHVDLDDTTLEVNAIVAALEEELGVPVRAAQGASPLQLRVRGRTLSIRYERDEAPAVEREVELPKDPDAQLEVVALLGGNLVRDEAAELLAELEPPSEAVAVPQAGTRTTPVGQGPIDSEAVEAQSPAQPEPGSEGQPGAAPERVVEAGAGSADGGPDREQPAQAPAKQTDPQLADAPLALAVAGGLAFPPDLAKRRVTLALGLFDLGFARLDGFAASGFVLRDRLGGEGFAAAGLWATSGESFEGFAAAGIFVRHRGDFRGFQGALVSTADGPFDGVQAGLVAVHSGRMQGAQLGLVNVGRRVRGAQVGLINVAAEPGTQVGLVNVAGGAGDAHVGLLNFVPGLRHQIVTWGSAGAYQLAQGEPGGVMGHVGWRMLLHGVTVMLHVGAGECGSQRQCGVYWAPGFTVGGRVPVAERWFFEFDGQYRFEAFDVAEALPATGTSEAPFGLHTLTPRISWGLQLTEAWALFAGAGLTVGTSTALDSVHLRDHLFFGMQVL